MVFIIKNHMTVIENNIIPFKGFLAINLFGLFFVRKEYWVKTSEARKKVTYNHEDIHTAQMKELLYLPFYVIYFLEWAARLFINGPKKAYENISFEKEAYEHERDFEYLKNRKHFAQWRKKK